MTDTLILVGTCGALLVAFVFYIFVDREPK